MTEWNIILIEKIERTSDIKSFRFERPEDLNYLPGQFIFIYIPGGDGGMIMHHFSFSSSPTEDYIEFTTRIRDSEFKKRLDQLPIGISVKVASVSGNFTLSNGYSKVVFVCGGIGITAARSNIKWAKDTQAQVDVLLLYGNRNSQNIAFKKELEECSGDNFKVFHTLSNPEENWKEPTGFINSEFILSSVPDYQERIWFLSGSPAMVKSVATILTEEIDIDPDKIKKENYVGY
ncbi:MAG: ferredoxin--NADP reductase [Promethearchaeota archaeon]|jgi:ferredoxin-NADP reductase